MESDVLDKSALSGEEFLLFLRSSELYGVSFRLRVVFQAMVFSVVAAPLLTVAITIDVTPRILQFSTSRYIILSPRIKFISSYVAHFFIEISAFGFSLGWEMTLPKFSWVEVKWKLSSKLDFTIVCVSPNDRHVTVESRQFFFSFQLQTEN